MEEKENIKSVETNSKTQKNKKDEKIESLEAQVSFLMEKLNQLVSNQNVDTKEPKVEKTTNKTEVNIVYMSSSPGIIKTTNSELLCNNFGETFVVSRTQFDEIVGKYRHWFNNGILAVDPCDKDIAIKKGLKTSDEYDVSKEKLENMGTMTLNELEDFWKSLKLEGSKQALVQYYKLKYMENANGFTNRARIELLNRLTNNGFKRELVEVSGGDLKIRQTDMIEM